MGEKVTITTGAFAGFAAEIVEDRGDKLLVAVDIFGRRTEVTITRADLGAAAKDPRTRVMEDFAERLDYLERAYWIERGDQPATPLEAWRAFETAKAVLERETFARRDALLVELEAMLGSLPSAERSAAFEADLPRWLPHSSAVDARATNLQRVAVGALEVPRVARLAGRLLERGCTEGALERALGMLARWDDLDRRGVFPHNPDGTRIVFRVRLHAYVGKGGTWRIVFECLGASHTEPSGSNEVRILDAGGDARRSRSFHRSMIYQRTADREPSAADADADADAEEAEWAHVQELIVALDDVTHVLRPTFEDVVRAGLPLSRAQYEENPRLGEAHAHALALTMLPSWLIDPARELGLVEELGYCRLVFRDEGPSVTAHLARGEDVSPSDNPYHLDLAVKIALAAEVMR